MDLGQAALAFEWIVQGEAFTGIGAAPELRVDSLAGDRAELADSGYTSGACGGETDQSPNVIGRTVRYAHQRYDCDGRKNGGEETHAYFESFAPAFRSFGYAGPQPPRTRYAQAQAAGGLVGANVRARPGPLVVALAWDGAATYWLRVRPANPSTDDYFTDTSDCEPSHSICTLMRTTGLAGILRAESRPERPLPQGF